MHKRFTDDCLYTYLHPLSLSTFFETVHYIFTHHYHNSLRDIREPVAT